MSWSAGKIGTIIQKPAPAIGLSAPPIGCVLDLSGLPGGGNKIYDRSPYGNIGTIIGATWVRLPSGLWALSFDGSDDYIYVPDHSSLDMATVITLELWIQPKGDYGSGTNAGIIAKPSSGGPWWIYITRSTGVINAKIRESDTNEQVLNSTKVVSTDTWYFVCLVANGSTAKLYINTTEEGTVNYDGTLLTNVNSVQVGRQSTAYCELIIGEVRIYNRALSALEIQNHFNREKHLFGVW